MIHFKNVSKHYHIKGVHKVVIDDINLVFPPKTNIAILGHNGAGKSTLVNLIAGAIQPTKGRIIRRGSMSWPLGFGGGFGGTMTGIENARFVARMYGQDTEKVIDFVKEFSELGESFNLPINTYSSGMSARLAFGISMAVDFAYYLIDEITAVGDARFKQKCDQIFQTKLKDSNVIMISHQKETIRKFCEAGAVLHRGKLVYYPDIEDAIAVHDENQAKH